MPPVEANCDAQGGFDARVPALYGIINITVIASGGTSTIHHVALRAREIELGVIRISPKTERLISIGDSRIFSSHPFLGAVVDSDTGGPVENANINISRVNRTVPFATSATSNAQGKFEFAEPDGAPREWKINITKPGYIPLTVERRLPPNHQFRLVRGMPIEVAAPPGASIRNIRVLVQTKVGEGWRQAQAECGAADAEIIDGGKWNITIPRGDFARATVECAGGASIISGDVDLKQFDGLRPRVVTKRSEPVVAEETIVDAESRPAAGLPVDVIVTNDPASIGYAFENDITDANGKLSVRTESGAGFTIAAGADSPFVIEDTRLRPPQRARGGVTEASPAHRFVAHRASRVVGTLTFSGKAPVESVPVAAWRLEPSGSGATTRLAAMTATAADGSFTFERLYRGRYAIVAKRPFAANDSDRDFETEWPDFEHFPWPHAIVIEKDGDTANCDLALPFAQQRYVAGTVTIEGAPLSGAVVALAKWDDGSMRASGITDRNGNYKIPVVRAGDYRLELNYKEIHESRRIKVDDDQSRQVHFDCTPIAISGSLSFEGSSPGRVRVALQRAREESREFLWQMEPVETWSAENGSYQITAPRAGTYRLIVYDPSHRFASAATESFTLEPGRAFEAPTLNLPLERTIHITAADVAGSPGTGRIWIMSADENITLPQLAQAWLFPGKDGLVVHGLGPAHYRVRLLPFDDVILDLVRGDGPAELKFTKVQPGAESRPFTGDSAYHSREAEAQKKWDFAGEVPFLYEEEEWNDYVSGK